MVFFRKLGYIDEGIHTVFVITAGIESSTACAVLSTV